MKKYHVYFEVYGKKMKTTLYAISKVQAENIVRSKLVIDKIEDTGIEKGSLADTLGTFDDIINSLTDKK